jgi:hypothetical protein
MGKAMNLKFISAFTFSIAVLVGAAQAANCSLSALRKVVGQAQNLEQSSRACDRATSGSAPDIAQMCRACRAPILQILSIERTMRHHAGCFHDYEGRKLMCELAKVRGQLNFVRRGCGF